MKKTHQDKIKAITGMASIPFVMPGIASASEGHVVSEDGLIALVEAVEAGEAAIASLTEAQSNLATAKTELSTATASLSTAQKDLKAAQDEVVTLKAKVEELGKADGGRFSNPDGSNPDAEGNQNLGEEFMMEEDKQMAAYLGKK